MYDDSFEGAFVSWHPEPLYLLLIRTSAKDSNVVELEHTQEQLAEYFGVTRPALSKEIGRLVDEGFISITRRKVTILNKTALTCML